MGQLKWLQILVLLLVVTSRTSGEASSSSPPHVVVDAPAEALSTLPDCSPQLDHAITPIPKRTLIVSTFDGKLHALSFDGREWINSWSRKFDNHPLLSSTLQNAKITVNGLPYRMIPALDGSLFAFNGKHITQMPITADSLLKSSHKFGDHMIAAGKSDSRTFGVRLSDGSLLYECSFDHCPSSGSDNDSTSASDEILIVQKLTRGVRVLNPRTGKEKWNMLTGEFRISISNSETDCDTGYDNRLDDDEYVILNLPNSELVFVSTESGIISSKRKFDSPIASAWLVRDGHVSVIDPFAPTGDGDEYRTGIFIGQTSGQVYIQPSPGSSQQNLQVIEVPAPPKAQLTGKPSRSTRPTTGKELAVFDNDLRLGLGFIYDKEKCDTIQPDSGSSGNTSFDDFFVNDSIDQILVLSLWYWWKEILGISLCLAFLMNVIAIYLKKQVQDCMDCESASEDSERPEQQSRGSSPVAKSVITNTSKSPAVAESFVAPVTPFISRFESDFENIQCRGRGGFGVVFEARKKLEAVSYAVKRIRMPSKPDLQEKVMREVKALANMHHPNIVRYYTSWTEEPPIGWQEQFDHKIISQQKSDSACSMTSFSTISATESSAVMSTQDHDGQTGHKKHLVDSICEEDSLRLAQAQSSNDSYVVFAEQTGQAEAESQIEHHSSPEQASANSVVLAKENKSRRSPVPKTFLFITMELCEKQTLREWLQENNNYSLRDRRRVFAIFRQITEAVDYVHSSGLLHRDLKPSNIFFSSDGAVKVGDFGLVTAAVEGSGSNGSDNSSPTQSQSPASLTMLQNSGSSSGVVNHTDNVGTFLYMSPDQLGGVSYSNKVDIYSLGVILYELLVPFRTEMERLHTLKSVRELNFPPSFCKKFASEEKLLRLLLATNPAERPAAGDILSHEVLLTYKSSEANPSRRRTISITESGDQT